MLLTGMETRNTLRFTPNKQTLYSATIKTCQQLICVNFDPCLIAMRCLMLHTQGAWQVP